MKMAIQRIGVLVMLFALFAGAFPTAVSLAADKKNNSNPEQKAFDPASFVLIYEAPRNRKEIATGYGDLIYGSRNQRSTKLAVDEKSTIVIVPDLSQMNLDMALNNLYITAELSSGDTKTPLEVVGYSEIGKAQNAAMAQQGMSFQSTSNIVAMMLNLAFTAEDIQKNVLKNPSELEGLTFDKEKDKDLPPVLKRAKERFRLLKPEISSIADFMLTPKNLNLVEILGTEVFWMDRTSMQSIATQYKNNLATAFDSSSTLEAQYNALKDMLQRTLLILEDLKDPITEIHLMTEDFEKYGAIAAADSEELNSDDQMKSQIKRLMSVQAERKKIGTSPEIDELAKSLATAIYAKKSSVKALRRLGKMFAPGYISLESARAKDGDILTIKIEARSSDVEGPGIPALFEIAVKQFGAKLVLADSLLFIKRLGLKASDISSPDSTPPGRGLQKVNFAPSPGVTFGVNYFKRGNRPWNKFVRAIAPGVGANVSFMNYNDPSFDLKEQKFVESTGVSVQVGIGVVGMLFNNKIQLSYGYNLNADVKRRYFGAGFSFLEIGKTLTKYLK